MSLLFALDASGRTSSVCLVSEGQIIYEELLDEGLTHSETLLPQVQRALQATGFSAADIASFAVTNGPGSFTGLRIGLALVKGLAFPQDIPVTPVSTLEAMARATGESGLLLSAINARRGEVYWAAFRRQNGLQRLTPDAACAAIEAENFIKMQTERVLVVGDGGKLCYTGNDYTADVTLFSQPLLVARGAALAALDCQNPVRAVHAGQLRPVYLRLSQAERERLEKLQGPPPAN